MSIGNVSLIKHMRMARFSFAIPLVRDIYYAFTGVFIVLCFYCFFVLCFIDVLLRRNKRSGWQNKFSGQQQSVILFCNKPYFKYQWHVNCKLYCMEDLAVK